MLGRIIGCLIACGLMASGSLQAHHSLAGVYDMQKEGEVKGTFVAIKLTNPHGSLTVAVKNADGTSTDWVMTTGSGTRSSGMGAMATARSRRMHIHLDSFTPPHRGLPESDPGAHAPRP